MVQMALFVGALVTFVLGAFVLLNNPHSTLFRLYLVFSVFSAGWVTVNALSIPGAFVLQNTSLLLMSRLITPLSLFASLSFLYFIEYFRTNKLRSIDLALALPSIAVAAFSFSAANVHLNKQGTPELGNLYPVYLAVILLNVILIFVMLFGPLRRASVSGKKAQMTYIRLGTFGALIPAVGFGTILPMFSDSSLTNLTPAFLLVFLIFAAVAIVRHRLFDLRLAVARVLVYGLSIAAMVVLYMVVAFGLTNLVYDVHVDLLGQIYLALFSAILALVFQPVRRLFNRLTNKFFYQDAYDSQLLFNELNRILVSTVGLDALLVRTLDVIAKNLKPEFGLVALLPMAGGPPKIVGDAPPFHSEDLQLVHSKRFQAYRNTVIVADHLSDKDTEFQTVLVRNHIGVLVRLGGKSSGSEGRDYGHIILGPKKSGNPYSQQDARVLEALANELALAIQNALRFEEINNFNETLQGKVNQATNELRRANDKLKTLDATKDEFISMASHQLRTPLTSVKGYLSMVLEGDVGPINEQQRQMLEQSYNSSQRMVYLISDLLNLSRLNTGKFVIETTSVDLSEVVQVEVEQLAETAKSRNLVLTYQRPANFPRLMLDETKIHQVVMNLIDNAIYYTPSGGTVTVNLKETATAVEFTVTDTGIGVPKKVQHKLFSKFYRAGNAQAARPDGTGLGLFMAKKVVVAQGGAIIFDSTEGKGSTFGFRFTKAKHLAASEPTGVHRTKAVALSK